MRTAGNYGIEEKDRDAEVSRDEIQSQLCFADYEAREKAVENLIPKFFLWGKSVRRGIR